MACWSTKATVSLKRVKIEEKLLWRAYRNSITNAVSTVLSRPPTACSSPRFIRGSQSRPKTPIAIISETGEATNFKFGWNISRVHPSKRPLKILIKRGRGRIQGLPSFWVPPIISGTGKATNFEFCTHIHSISRRKSPLKTSGKVAVGIVRDSRQFSGHSYVWRIVRSSLR